MGLFTSKKFTNMEDLFIEQVQDLYDAELRLVEALPDMVEAAESQELKLAFEQHLNDTKRHVTRLEKVFQKLSREPSRESCEAMKGLIKEGAEVVGAKGDAAVKDAALIAAAQRVEHYEIAGYGTARSFAQWLGRSDLADLLQQSLDDEGRTDKALTSIAETFANAQAARA